jgi:hypothetical protein
VDARFETADGDVVALYRPVGQAELDLIRDTDWRAFPPRLDWQPIFYPVLNQEYATMIAQRWNTKDPASGNVGYVLRFCVAATVVERYDVQVVGGSVCRPEDRVARPERRRRLARSPGRACEAVAEPPAEVRDGEPTRPPMRMSNCPVISATPRMPQTAPSATCSYTRQSRLDSATRRVSSTRNARPQAATTSAATSASVTYSDYLGS